MVHTQRIPLLKAKPLPIPPETIQDKVHNLELEIAEHIRTTITSIAKRSDGVNQLLLKLNLNTIQLQALLTRKHWTLRFALTTAVKLGLKIGTIAAFPHQMSTLKSRMQ